MDKQSPKYSAKFYLDPETEAIFDEIVVWEVQKQGKLVTNVGTLRKVIKDYHSRWIR